MLSGLLQPEKVSDAFEHLGRAAHSEESWFALMPNAKLRYSLNKVKQAGKDLRDGAPDWDTLIDAMEIFDNWRDCHTYPMAYFYDSLSASAKQFQGAINVVQRPKRLESIVSKLQRYKPGMALTTMQDIAGCRAIVGSNSDIPDFVEYCKPRWDDHELYDTDDYIAEPKPNGYRSLHQIYRFRGDDKSFDGRFVEIQFRSRYQNMWAAAVETVDRFEAEQLKVGAGGPLWERFFALMGSVIAQVEGCPIAPGTPENDYELAMELKHYAEELDVERRIRAYGSLANAIPNNAVTGRSGVSGYSGSQQPTYFLIELSPSSKRIQVKGYDRRDIARASRDLAIAELGNRNVVLVAASDLEALKEAYPSWIVDTRDFLSFLKLALNLTTF